MCERLRLMFPFNASLTSNLGGLHKKMFLEPPSYDRSGFPPSITEAHSM